MKTIIITGGSGFIGCNAVPHFVKLGWRVINLDVQRPLALDQINYWKKCDLMDLTQL
ncbi:MAG: NAD-dependent epimerase/dehydratase family protein, partial [Cyanothece sp. SIO1E1]|nr:NAD-dependent epimerase/dehydratase family protein [Cyanothece sp. SIO1E1]